MDEINSLILSIQCINYRMCAMIIDEISGFSRFDSPDKMLATGYRQSVNWNPCILIWKIVVPDISNMLCSMLRNLYATGSQLLLLIKKNALRVSIITLPFHILQKTRKSNLSARKIRTVLYKSCLAFTM